MFGVGILGSPWRTLRSWRENSCIFPVLSTFPCIAYGIISNLEPRSEVVPLKFQGIGPSFGSFMSSRITPTPIPRSFYETTPLQCARGLIGAVMRWGATSGRIVETEAYDAEDDPACHTFFRKSARAFVREHPPGTAYVYLNYGIHWMANVLIKGRREGFVLIRALEPMEGIGLMMERRGKDRLSALTSGPGKLTSALGMTGAAHGHDWTADPDYALLCGQKPHAIAEDYRIGISVGKDLPWRFFIAGNPHVSSPGLPAEVPVRPHRGFSRAGKPGAA